MRAAVARSFASFTATFEGCVTWLYLDTKGLVTTGRGNLVDPVELALPLPWRLPDGTPADRAAITGEWQLVKARARLAPLGGVAFRAITSLRLSPQAVDDLTASKARQFEAQLRGSFQAWETWPADAQLGALSMAWAMGAGFVKDFPRFTAAASTLAFAAAAAECDIDAPGDAAVARRNAADRILFTNASIVLADPATYDPDTLYWPTELRPAVG